MNSVFQPSQLFAALLHFDETSQSMNGKMMSTEGVLGMHMELDGSPL